jgi:hypothetical protein
LRCVCVCTCDWRLLDGVRKLAAMAAGLHRHNVAFLCNFLLRDLDACIDTLVATGRAPEAAFFARTYKPSRVSELVSKVCEDARVVIGACDARAVARFAGTSQRQGGRVTRRPRRIP